MRVPMTAQRLFSWLKPPSTMQPGAHRTADFWIFGSLERETLHGSRGLASVELGKATARGVGFLQPGWEEAEARNLGLVLDGTASL